MVRHRRPCHNPILVFPILKPAAESPRGRRWSAARALHACRPLSACAGRSEMTVAKVIEITAESENSFEDAMRKGIAKASESVHDIRGAWVKEQQVVVRDGLIVNYRVDLKLTFVLD